MFANPRKRKLMPKARKALRQRKRRRPRPSTWLSRRREHDKQPLACPLCGATMTFYGTLFGPHDVIATIAEILPLARLPPGYCVRRSRGLEGENRVLASHVWLLQALGCQQRQQLNQRTCELGLGRSPTSTSYRPPAAALVQQPVNSGTGSADL
jgi:hypothetical protein